MVLQFLSRIFGLTDVREDRPLPVHDSDRETQARNADRLLVSDLSATADANRDLLGNTSTDQPTLSNTLPYHTLLWYVFKSGADSINYIVEARACDFSGNPLGTGWLQIATGTITGATNTWHRIVITQTDGLYYDQYRFRFQRGGSSDVSQRSVIVGVRR